MNMSIKHNHFPLLIIIGPSGAGKSTIIKKLHDEGLIVLTPTWTTRPPRPGEIDMGIEHHFATNEEFDKKVSDKFFLETVKMFGLSYRYGLPEITKAKFPKISLVMLRASLINLFNKYYDNYIIYQIEDNISNIEKRLLDRKMKGEALGTRLNDYREEVELGRSLANRVFINTGIDKLHDEIKESIKLDFTK